jgi:hypothetical protein
MTWLDSGKLSSLLDTAPGACDMTLVGSLRTELREPYGLHGSCGAESVQLLSLKKL